VRIDAATFREHERFLWGLGYRMLGTAADADDLVQDTFARALEKPPADTSRPLRPWLVTVAMNLARDRLRRRRRTRYTGPWLPSPVETTEHGLPGEEPPSYELPSTEGRYDLLESVSMAFLIAMEALSPIQRAVLILRDVFDYSVAEAAAALGLSESNVKVSHLRARRRLEVYDRARRPITAALQAETRATMERFLGLALVQDVAGMEAMLAEDARGTTDGGGEYRAALNAVVGASRVARFLVGLAAKQTAASPDVQFDVRILNGLPALIVRVGSVAPGYAPVYTMQIEIGADGAVREVRSVLAGRKLTAIV